MSEGFVRPREPKAYVVEGAKGENPWGNTKGATPIDRGRIERPTTLATQCLRRYPKMIENLPAD